MLFSMQGKPPQGNGKIVHCGVLEFTAEEGKCYAPSWMMRQIGIDEGGLVEVANVTLPLGTYVKVQPHSSAFIDNISNHRAVLEYALKNYAALTVGDNIVFNYNKRDYVLSVNEVKPDNPSNNHAISVVETNIQIDFDPPKDTLSKEMTSQAKKSPTQSSAAAAADEKKKPQSKSGFFEPGSLQSLMFYDPDVSGPGSILASSTPGDASNDVKIASSSASASASARKGGLSSSSPAKMTSSKELSRSVGYRVDGKPIKKPKKKKAATSSKKVNFDVRKGYDDEDDDDYDYVTITSNEVTANGDGDGAGAVEVVPFTGVGRSLSGVVVNNGPRLTRSRNCVGSLTSSLSGSNLSISSSCNGDYDYDYDESPERTGNAYGAKKSSGHTLNE